MKRMEQLVQRLQEQQLALPIWFENNRLKVLDQKKLPSKEEVYSFSTVK